MRTMLATIGRADVPDERLAEKLAEVFEQTRKATAAIAALHPDNPVAQAQVVNAAEAHARGDRDEAGRYLQAAREAEAARRRRWAWRGRRTRWAGAARLGNDAEQPWLRAS